MAKIQVPLIWAGDQGYVCSNCRLHVVIPKSEAYRGCPSCAGVPLATAMKLLLEYSGPGALNYKRAVEVLTPLMNALDETIETVSKKAKESSS